MFNFVNFTEEKTKLNNLIIFLLEFEMKIWKKKYWTKKEVTNRS